VPTTAVTPRPASRAWARSRPTTAAIRRHTRAATVIARDPNDRTSSRTANPQLAEPPSRRALLVLGFGAILLSIAPCISSTSSATAC
jgi:hypothetical protein